MPRINTPLIFFFRRQPQIHKIICRCSGSGRIEPLLIRIIIFKTCHRVKVMIFVNLTFIIQNGIVGLIQCTFIRSRRMACRVHITRRTKIIFVECLILPFREIPDRPEFKRETFHQVKCKRLIDGKLIRIVITDKLFKVILLVSVTRIRSEQHFTFCIVSPECRRYGKNARKIIRFIGLRRR